MVFEVLSENALAVLRRRYLAKDAQGNSIETPDELFWRVARHVAHAEKNVHDVAEPFYRMMAALDFLPNSPALMNAGRELGQCFACFVLPVADALANSSDEGIFDAVRSAAIIHKTGGGTGFDFSRLRPEGASVSTTHGKTSGPISFMRIFNAATEAIHQGGFRRGANMGILRVDHPDILDFIHLKRDSREMTNFNLSVAITDEFIAAVREDRAWQVQEPQTGRRIPLRDKQRDADGNLTGYADRVWTAGDLWALLIHGAWESGEPGLVFIDRINSFNPTPQIGRIEATNPCGEQPLLPFEACNLGSINLGHFVQDRRMDWERLSVVVHRAVRFLDDVIEVNRYPKPQIEAIVRGNRKIGLGVMGWADVLYQLRIRYDSEEAVALARGVMSFIREESWKASMNLAVEKGGFPNFQGSLFETADLDHPYFAEVWREACRKEGRRVPMRNATVTTIAPTGTLSIIAGASGGIEPLFSLAFYRNVLEGEKLIEVHPHFRAVAEREGFFRPDLLDRLIREGSGQDISEIPPHWRNVFRCAHDIPPEWHMQMQAAFQEFTDNAVSKTVNFPERATVGDVRRVYDLALELGVKGVTAYRDGSRRGQPMALESCSEC